MMRASSSRQKSCSYVVALDGMATDAEVRELALYLSELGIAGCEVVVLDDSPRDRFDRNARQLRWVSRHLPVGPGNRTRTGEVDLLRAGASSASCEKVIVAGSDVRWPESAIGEVCDDLDRHEAVEPHEYFDPLPWWAGIDAGRALLNRGIDPEPGQGSSYALRRSVVGLLRVLPPPADSDRTDRRLAGIGAEIFTPAGLFVRRFPRGLGDWLRSRPVDAALEFAAPMRSAFFLSIVPMLLFLALAGGIVFSVALIASLTLGSIALALRGRSGAAGYYPLHACLYAPLALFERSVTIYWALFRKLRVEHAEAARAADDDPAQRNAAGESRRKHDRR